VFDLPTLRVGLHKNTTKRSGDDLTLLGKSKTLKNVFCDGIRRNTKRNIM